MLLFTSTKRFILFALYAFSGIYTIFVGPFNGAGLLAIPIALFSFFIAACFIIPEILYIRKTSEQLWSKWDLCHNSTAQQKRMDRVSFGELTPYKVDEKTRCALFVGGKGGKYRTLLTSCTCPDFKERHVPCKHMYYLANHMHLYHIDM